MPLSERFEPEERIRLLADLAHEAKLAWALFWDPRVSFLLKLVPLSGMMYLVFPENLLAGGSWGCLCFPINLLDDLIILALTTRIFVNSAPQFVVEELERRLD